MALLFHIEVKGGNQWHPVITIGSTHAGTFQLTLNANLALIKWFTQKQFIMY